jgi:hypothetical protein
MPTDSTFPRIDIPDVDVWAFLFERKNKEYPDDKGTFSNWVSLPRLENQTLTF